MTQQTRTIAESNNFIVLDKYVTEWEASDRYQSESELEHELIQDLRNQGYEFVPDLTSQSAMLTNVRVQLQTLNQVVFSEGEWRRFTEGYLDNPSDTLIDKTRKIHDNYICDFTFDDGRLENISLIDKKNLIRNKLQVIQQFEQTGTHANRYDVTILVNGLPLVQVELKKRGVAIREAFNQIHRYSKESFNSDNSLFKYLQLFVISNGTDTRYFANTTKRDKNSFDFTMNWARSDNTLIKDLRDFTATFFQKHTLLNILFNYSVFDTSDTLLIMRPYQIAATERILWKINSAFQSKKWSSTDGGGFIWHTTGSGKTLTSFKAARLATELDFIDKVFFVVDRKDLDYQTMKEYQRFSPDSVNGSDSTAGLKRNIDKDDNKIIVTTIQKLNNLMKGDADLPVYQQQVVFIFDECHRSQFGEAQKNLRKNSNVSISLALQVRRFLSVKMHWGMKIPPASSGQSCTPTSSPMPFVMKKCSNLKSITTMFARSLKRWKRKQTRRSSAPQRINTLCCIRCGLAKSLITFCKTSAKKHTALSPVQLASMPCLPSAVWMPPKPTMNPSDTSRS